MIKDTVAEIQSHDELNGIEFAIIQINHNAVSAPHTDNNGVGYPSIALGLGENEGGRLRVEGRAPIGLRSHAVVLDGLETHTSSKLNGDRWSFVLYVHAS